MDRSDHDRPKFIDSLSELPNDAGMHSVISLIRRILCQYSRTLSIVDYNSSVALDKSTPIILEVLNKQQGVQMKLKLYIEDRYPNIVWDDFVSPEEMAIRILENN